MLTFYVNAAKKTRHDKEINIQENQTQNHSTITQLLIIKQEENQISKHNKSSQYKNQKKS